MTVPKPSGPDVSGRTWADCDCKPQKCSVCARRRATLYVPIFNVTRPLNQPKAPVRHEHWCAPCRDRIFPDGKEYAWCSSEGEWFHGQHAELPPIKRFVQSVQGHV